MQRIETSLSGVLELHPKVFRDGRGFFLETFHLAKFLELGIAETFVQDNHSSSKKGTLRGLHYQLQHPQAKLCRVVEGEALDVVLDALDAGPGAGAFLRGEGAAEAFLPDQVLSDVTELGREVLMDEQDVHGDLFLTGLRCG